MTITIEKPGLESTVQGAPRKHYRHLGMPWSGPADALSFSIANHLVGNDPYAAAIEVCLGGFCATFAVDTVIALTGAPAPAFLNGSSIPYHHSIHVSSGSTLELAFPDQGVRTYLAISNGVQVDAFLKSTSTYLPAGIGGFQGRKLQEGDQLQIGTSSKPFLAQETPVPLRPFMTNEWVLRVCLSAESTWLKTSSEQEFFTIPRTAGPRMNRMGLQLLGDPLEFETQSQMKSSPVFPGVIQCPSDGVPFLLSVDAQTTGGYPRIASVARCDRHRMGQIRPGDTICLQKNDPTEASLAFRKKLHSLRKWVSSIEIA